MKKLLYILFLLPVLVQAQSIYQAVAAPSSIVGGDASGTIGNLTVNRVKGIPVSATAPTTGQVFMYDGANWIASTLPPTTGNLFQGTSDADRILSTTAVKGDIYISNTGNPLTSKTWILALTDPTIAGNWTEIIVPTAVSSVTSTATIENVGTLPNLQLDVKNGSITPAKLSQAYLTSFTEVDGDPANENQTVSSGTGIGVVQTGQNFAVTNSAPDQTVTITGATGTYPNFTLPASTNIYNSDGTVTSPRTVNLAGNAINFSGAQMSISADAAANQQQLVLKGAFNANQQMLLGYNTDNDYGFLQPIIQGFAFQNLVLNESGGNVGVGKSLPTEKLDIIGNVRFSGALMPNNTAGTSGQVLTSAGAGVVPTWTTPSTSSTVQTINATGTVTGWSSIVLIGATPLTANITITLPTVVGATGKEVKFIRLDNTAFSVTIAPFAGQTVTLQSAGTEINTQNGAITITAVDATNSRQSENIGTAPVMGDYVGVERRSADVNTNLFTIPSTNTTTFGTLLGTANRVNLSSATISGNLTVNGANGTIAITKSGVYTITTNISLQSAGATGQWGQMVKNGATVLTATASYNQAGGAGLQIVLNYTGSFIAGDLIDVRINSTAAGTIGITGYSYSVVQGSGFLPIIGSSVDYAFARPTTNSVAVGDIAFSSILQGSGITVSANAFQLKAGKTYNLFAAMNLDGADAANAVANYQWTDAANVQIPNSSTGVSGNVTSINGGFSIVPAGGVITVTADMTVKLRITLSGSMDALNLASSHISITQIGTTATLANVMSNVSNLPTGGAIVAGTVDPYVIGYNVAQTTASQVLSIPAPTTTTLNRVIYINNTGTVSFQVDGFTISTGQSQAFIWNGTAWSNFTNNTNQNVLQESYENLGITDGQTINTTLTDVAGSSFTIPSAGKWLVQYIVTGNTGTTQFNAFALYNSSNVLIPSSQSAQGTVNTDKSNFIGFAYITTTGAEIFKLRGQSSGSFVVSNIPSTFSSSTGTSKISYEKIGGFLPITGQITNRINISSRAVQTTSLAVGNPILFNSPDVVGAGITQSAGVFTLPANGEYLLEGGVGIVTGTELIFQWRNITTNTLIGTSANIHTTSAGRNSLAQASVTVGATPITVRLEIILNNAVTGLSAGDVGGLGRGNWANITQVGSVGFSDLPVANGTNFVNTSTSQLSIGGVKNFTSNVGINQSTPTSMLNVNGSFALPFTSTGASDLTVTGTMYTINTNNVATAITVTLPTPVGITNRIYVVKRDQGSVGVVTIATATGQVQSIAGTFAATTTLAALGVYGQSLMFQSDGINWHLIH
jgi:hypothetical protein